MSAIVDDLAARIGAGLSWRYRDDRALRETVRRYAVRDLGWTFLGRPDQLDRLARLAAVELVAAVGCAAALRRHHPAPASLPEDVAPGALRTALRNLLAVQRLSLSEEPPALLHDLALDLLPEPELRRLWAGSVPNDLAQSPSEELGPLWEAAFPAAERRQAGQFYSAVDPIDLILALCLRSPEQDVLDPACGSGAFLVRALARLRTLAPGLPPAALARRLHGVDLDPHALRLAGYSLVARCGTAADLRHADFFTLAPLSLPSPGTVIGNPPYTRQETVDDRAAGSKAAALNAVAGDWGYRLSGRTGLHVPFLLHAAAFLPRGGRLGMLTSNSWLSADYGAALRRFLVERCRVVAVIVPGGERWFGAAVNPLILVAEREDDPARRATHHVRFVTLKRPLGELIGAAVGDSRRWAALDDLVARFERAGKTYEDADLRVRLVAQPELAGGAERSRRRVCGMGSLSRPSNALAAPGKWATYAFAPAACFTLLRRAHDRLVPLGEIAGVRRGLTTGCNPFFYLRDVGDGLADGELAALGIRREQLGALCVVAAADGSRHLVEARFLRPIVLSPREVDGLVVAPAGLRHRVLLLPPDREALTDTHALAYLQRGEPGARGMPSGAAPAAARVTCASRRAWWSLRTHLPGAILWFKTHYERHLAPLNPTGLLADCNLYHLTPRPGVDVTLLAALLNSTLAALLKELHGRANLGEGALKTEVGDLLALPVPDPRRLAPGDAARIRCAWEGLLCRPVSGLPAELERPDRQALDEAVLVALGFADEAERRERRQELYAGVVELLGRRLWRARPSGAGRAAKVITPADLAAAALADLGEKEGEEGEDNTDGAERRLTAILAGLSPDRKLRTAALQVARTRWHHGAPNLASAPTANLDTV